MITQRPVVITLSLHTFPSGQTDTSQHQDHEQDGSVRRKHPRNQSSEALYFRMPICTEIGWAEHRKSLPHVAWRRLCSTWIQAKSLFQIPRGSKGSQISEVFIYRRITRQFFHTPHDLNKTGKVTAYGKGNVKRAVFALIIKTCLLEEANKIFVRSHVCVGFHVDFVSGCFTSGVGAKRIEARMTFFSCNTSDYFVTTTYTQGGILGCMFCA